MVLDLADPLAGDVEDAAHLIECEWGLAVQAIAKLEHTPLPLAERGERARQRLVAKDDVCGLVGQRLRVVFEEVAELGLVVVADRLLERDRYLRRPPDLVDLVHRQLELLRDLLRCRLAALFGAQLALGAQDLVQLLDDMNRHADRSGLVGERAGDGLADPPGRVGRELEAAAVVELLSRAHEADRPLLDQVEERQPLVAVALGDRDDQAQVRFDHLRLGRDVAPLDPLGELDLLRGRQQIDLADVLEKELKRVGRDLECGQRLLDFGVIVLVGQFEHRRRVDQLELALTVVGRELVVRLHRGTRQPKSDGVVARMRNSRIGTGRIDYFAGRDGASVSIFARNAAAETPSGVPLPSATAFLNCATAGSRWPVHARSSPR